MGVLGPVLAADAGLGRALDDRYYPGTYGQLGEITPETALSVPAVYACTALISEDIAKVPYGMYEDMGEAGNKAAPAHPLHELLHDQPNEYQTALEFREMITAFALLRGKGIARIHDGRRGPVDTLEPLHPDLVTEETTRSGIRRFKYRNPRNDFTEETLLADDVFVLRGRMGRSAIEFARSTLSLEISMEKYSAFMFTRGSKHQGVVSSPKLLADPVRKAFRAALDDYSIDGPRAGRPLLLEDGMTWHDVSLANRDMEFLAQRRFGIAQICRLFRVPPHKIAELERSTNNNIERQSIDYVTDTLLGWAIRWEQATRRDLILATGRFFAKHNLDGLLRGDAESRSKAYALAIQWGWMTRNEARRKEDWNPLPGLDDPLTPLNMTQGQDGAVAVTYAQPLAALGPGERSAVAGHLRLFASDAAARVVRREIAAMQKLAERSAGDPGGWTSGVRTFYAEHADHVTQALHVSPHEAQRYSRDQQAALLAQGPTAMEDWLVDRVDALTHLAMDQEDLAA
jgi:HK97 family phage portal protein